MQNRSNYCPRFFLRHEKKPEAAATHKAAELNPAIKAETNPPSKLFTLHREVFTASSDYIHYSVLLVHPTSSSLSRTMITMKGSIALVMSLLASAVIAQPQTMEEGSFDEAISKS